MSNLTAVIFRVPEITDQVMVTQQGGALGSHRGKTSVSENFRVDPTSTGRVLRAVHKPRLVLGDHTDSYALQITPDSPLLQAFEHPIAPMWAHLLAAHPRTWSARESMTWMKAPLVLSAALGLPFVPTLHVFCVVAETLSQVGVLSEARRTWERDDLRVSGGRLVIEAGPADRGSALFLTGGSPNC